jgi:hypothetical protein
MFLERENIEEVVLTIQRGGGDTFAVVAFRTGGFGITRNGDPLQCFFWPADPGNEHTSALLRLAGADKAARPVLQPNATRRACA